MYTFNLEYILSKLDFDVTEQLSLIFKALFCDTLL